MKTEDEKMMEFGRMVFAMLTDVANTPRKDTAYARRRVTYPGGAVELFVVKDAQLADLFEAAAREKCAITDVVVHSERKQ